jgi:hypothetical protein
MNKKIFIIILPIMLISIAIVFGGQLFKSKTGETTYITSDYIVLYTINDLAKQSDLIVLGTVTKVEDQHFNTARNTRDPSQPATDLYIKGTIYNIQVEKNLKGNASSEIHILQSENITFPNTNGEVSTVYITDDFLPISVGARYIFFLKAAETYPDSPYPDLFSGTAEPYRFRIDNGVAKAESPSQLAQDQYPMEKESTLLQEINAAVP